MSNNYREYEYDTHSTELWEQVQEDIKEAKEIEKRLEEIRNEKKEQIAKNVLVKDEVSDEEIETILDTYSLNGNEYLVDGALLTCDKALCRPIVLKIDNAQITFQGMCSEYAKLTRLKVYENGKSSNGLYVATVGDAIQGKNIFPFKCNCSLLPDRQCEIDRIKENMEYCKAYGTCSQLMKLNSEWENAPSNTSYFTYTDINDQNSSEKEGINMLSILFCKHGGLITPIKSGQVTFDLMEIFGDFNLVEYTKNGNALAKKLTKLNFSQEKIDLIIEATKEIYQSYYIIVDPVSLLSIIAQEGTGSFNTSSKNKAADGQHGVEKNFSVDLLRANSLIFGKMLGFMIYGDEFVNVVNANKELLGVEEGNFAQYANWSTPFINFNSNTIYAAPYAGHAQWHDNVEMFYESVRGEGSIQQYSDYISRLDKRMVNKIVDENNINIVNGNFKMAQDGQDAKGHLNGTYRVIWEKKG